ncbi:MAG: hypothetical protein MUQ30_15545, partial [Anaerolineae bacterium]|nr:hypothetical protein [Anaerolineae bacterium]
MKKLLKALLLVCMVSLALSLPAFAGAPTDVEGFFTYVPVPGDSREAGPNQFTPSWDDEWWKGDLIGTASTEYTLILHGEDPYSDPGKFVSTGVFEGTVLDSESGEAAIKLVGHQSDGVLWYGTWSIGRGTGGLEGVHGQGTWKWDVPSLDP